MVVIPAHNEADHLASSVKSVLTAATCLPLPVTVIVVLDGCDDDSAALAGQFGAAVHFVAIDARNVGAARAVGFSYARTLHEQAVLEDSRIWYATTDADSAVDADWLLRQTGADTDMVLGVMRIATWRDFPAAAVRRYLAAYRSKIRPDGNGHGHVHGANMGFRADSYWRVGGFAALAATKMLIWGPLRIGRIANRAGLATVGGDLAATARAGHRTASPRTYARCSPTREPSRHERPVGETVARRGRARSAAARLG